MSGSDHHRIVNIIEINIALSSWRLLAPKKSQKAHENCQKTIVIFKNYNCQETDSNLFAESLEKD